MALARRSKALWPFLKHHLQSPSNTAPIVNPPPGASFFNSPRHLVSQGPPCHFGNDSSPTSSQSRVCADCVRTQRLHQVSGRINEPPRSVKWAHDGRTQWHLAPVHHHTSWWPVPGWPGHLCGRRHHKRGSPWCRDPVRDPERAVRFQHHGRRRRRTPPADRFARWDVKHRTPNFSRPRLPPVHRRRPAFWFPIRHTGCRHNGRRQHRSHDPLSGPAPAVRDQSSRRKGGGCPPGSPIGRPGKRAASPCFGSRKR